MPDTSSWGPWIVNVLGKVKCVSTDGSPNGDVSRAPPRGVPRCGARILGLVRGAVESFKGIQHSENPGVGLMSKENNIRSSTKYSIFIKIERCVISVIFLFDIAADKLESHSCFRVFHFSEHRWEVTFFLQNPVGTDY